METKICIKCNDKKEINAFRTRLLRGEDYIINTCKKCENEQQRARNKTSERKLYLKEKFKSEEYKQKRLDLMQTEKYKQRVFKYRRTPEFKQKNILLNKTEHRIKYQKEYRKRDYVQERIKKHINSDEHKITVKKYLETESGKISRKKAKENWNNSDKRMIELLHNQSGVDKKLITPELIELKRITLKTKRLCQQLKNS